MLFSSESILTYVVVTKKRRVLTATSLRNRFFKKHRKKYEDILMQQNAVPEHALNTQYLSALENYAIKDIRDSEEYLTCRGRATISECMSDSTTAEPLNEHLNETGTPPHQVERTQKHLSLGIHNTPLRRYAVLSAIQLLRRIRPSDGNVLFLSNKLCVKFGPFVQLSEASTLQFIAQNTSIPVPKVYCAFVHKDCTYILMDRIDGKILFLDWRSRSAESKEKILQQLKKIVEELRSLPPPGPCICNVDGGPLFDFRFPGTSKAIGPFKTIHEFHVFLRDGVSGSNVYPEIGHMVALQDRPWPMPVFTHGDLSSLNIIARGDNVVGIIDWETSGWYPSYWEHSMAWYVNPWNVFWREEVGKFLESTPEDMEMEKIRLRYFGDV